MQSASNFNTLLCENIIKMISEHMKSGIKSFNTVIPIYLKIETDNVLAHKLNKLNELGYALEWRFLNFDEYFDYNDDDKENEDNYLTHFKLELNNCHKFPIKIVFMNHKD
jgi:hypothetical protein